MNWNNMKLEKKSLTEKFNYHSASISICMQLGLKMRFRSEKNIQISSRLLNGQVSSPFINFPHRARASDQSSPARNWAADRNEIN